jgi:hypothetical protein
MEVGDPTSIFFLIVMINFIIIILSEVLNMGFSPYILSTKSTNTDMTNSINEFVNTANDSYLYDLLEYNDILHDIDTSSKINYYRNLNNAILAESAGTEIAIYNEGIISSIVSKLVRIINAIIDFIKKVASNIFGIGSANKVNKEKLKNEANRFKNDSEFNFKFNSRYRPPNNNNNTTRTDTTNHAVDINKTYKFKIFHYPDIKSIDTQQYRACLNNINSELERVCSDNYSGGTASEKSKEMAFKTLGKLVNKYIDHKPNSGNSYNILDEKSFSAFVNSELCYIEEKEVNLKELLDIMTDIANKADSSPSDYSKRISEFEQDLKRAKKIVEQCNFTSKEQEKHANDLILQINSIVQAYSNMIMTISKYKSKELEYTLSVLYKIRDGNINEAGFIHGEQFDSDTLFDNEDYRDFNRTEWLDLNITTECYELKFEMVECAKRIALQEALILSDDDQYNKFDRLIAMREAEEAKTKANVNGIIQSIKKWLETFIQNIKNRYSKNAKILRRNMQFVEKPITIKEIRSSGDIIAGMYRIQQRLNIIPFNYDTMKDDLKDKETFFKNKILPNLKNTSQYHKRNVKWTDGMSIADYCKAYYGASMPEDKYPKCEFSTSDVEANKNNIVRFLQTENIFSAKNDLQTLENESKKVYSKTQTNTPATSNDQKAENNTAEQKSTEKPTNESYYSELYGMWFTEAEIEMGEKPEGQQQNNSTNSEEATAFRIYMETYKDVILAKMTASEFIVSELMQIMMAHIYSHMTPEQKKTETAAQGKENPQQNNKK